MSLWAHQTKGINRARTAIFGRRVLPGIQHGFGLFFEMGTGKTRTAVEIIRQEMNQERRKLRTLVFAPSFMVADQWKEEWLKSTKLLPHQVVILQKSCKQRLKKFTQREAAVYITNYESLLNKELAQAFREWKPEAVVFDESHKLKSPTAKRSKAAHALVSQQNQPPFALLLSGSPILRTPLDIFQQFKVMLGGFPDPRLAVRDNYYIFQKYYFADRNAGMPKDKHFPNWQPKTLERDGFDGMGRIKEIIDQHSMRVTKEECLDLPDEVPIIYKVDMTPVQAKAYEEMKKDLITYMQDKACVASFAMTKSLRLLQMTSGFAAVQDQDNVKSHAKFEATPKQAALEELLTEITPHSKVLVWAVWKENYDQIRAVCERVGVRYVEVHGDISDAEKRKAVEDFKNQEDIRVFFGHPGSGGIGLNLVVAPYSIFYSRTYSLEHYLQATSRNHRGGQTQKVTHYHLVCGGTIDELVLSKLQSKIEVGAEILGDVVKSLALQEKAV